MAENHTGILKLEEGLGDTLIHSRLFHTLQRRVWTEVGDRAVMEDREYLPTIGANAAYPP